MERVLEGLHWKILLVYLDDIIIYGKTFGEELDRIEAVFQRLRKAKLKLKPKKCHLFCKQVRFLGHVVSEEGVATDPEKIEAVKAWPTPTSVTELCGTCLVLPQIHKRLRRDSLTSAQTNGEGGAIQVDQGV